MPEPSMTSTLGSPGHHQDYGQQPHPLSMGSANHPSMVPQSRTQTPYPMATSTAAMTTSNNGILHPQSQFLRTDTDLSRLTIPGHDVTITSQQTPVSPRDHMLPTSTVNPERSHLCPTCSKGFKSKQQLAQHSLVHSGIRKHICNFCEKGFKQLCHLQQHIRIHTADKLHVCKFCQKRFSQLSQLHQHSRTHTAEHPFICKYCQKGFKQLAHLIQHTRIHTGEKPYKCTFDGCDRAFAQMANLHHHMRNHDEHVRKAANKQFHCMICHRAYTNESSLRNHTLKMHVPVKPLDHPDIIFSNLCKPRKYQKSNTNNSNTNRTIDLTLDSDGMKSPHHPGIVNQGAEGKAGGTFSGDAPRQSSFVRYLGEHLRQTLANESQNLSSSSAASTTQSLLTLHQALQEQSALLQQNRRDSVSNTEQRLQEDNSFFPHNGLQAERLDGRFREQTSSTTSTYARDKISANEQRSFQTSDPTLQENKIDLLSGKTQRISEQIIHRSGGDHDRDRVLEENSMTLLHPQRILTPSVDRRSSDQNPLIIQQNHNNLTLLTEHERQRDKVRMSMEENTATLHSRQMSNAPHKESHKMNQRQSDTPTSSKTIDHLVSRSNSLSAQTHSGLDHMTLSKEAALPTMNLAHYNPPPAPFHNYPPIPISMGIAPPAHLQHFLNSNLGPRLDNPVRVISENPLQRIMGNHHMTSLASSSNQNLSQNIGESLNFAHQK